MLVMCPDPKPLGVELWFRAARMATYTLEAFYLGELADLDPNEGNFTSENAGTILGSTFGGGGDPLRARIENLTQDDPNNDGIIVANDDGQTAESLFFDGASADLEAVLEYMVTLTCLDGTTATTTMCLLQDVNGHAFLTPFQTGQSENDPLDDKPIQSITFDAIAGDGFFGVVTGREPDAFIDGFVSGTNGDDTISGSYTDADGTVLNAYSSNDSVDAGAGNDTVMAGLGDDTLDGGDGNDAIGGGTTPAVTATSESLNWSAQSADEADLSGGFIQDTGVMDVSVSYID
jgi:hypothetical protein